MEIEMKIKGLVIDPISKMPIVVLEDIQKKRMLPIWIGVFEANAISLKVVTDVRDNTFYANIHCRHHGHTFIIDSRPSDAIALSLRMEAPVFVEEEVVEKAQSLKFDENLEDSEKLKKWLENLAPEDFGKYKM